MSKPLSDHKKLDNSFDIPTKGSFAKGGSFRALPKDISSVLVENKEDSKPERIENENKMLPTTEADEEVSQTEDLVSLELDPIFDRLCPKEEYKKDPVCKVCKKKFNPLKLRKKKYCKFCGNSVCENHARRKRADPQNAENFVRICVECDDKHIKRMILKDFEAELNEKERILAYWEQELKIQQSQINQHQAEFDQALLQKGRNERNYSEQMTFLTDDIARIKEETKKCEKENTVLTKDLNETQKKLADWDNSIQDSQREYQRLLVELSMLDNQIEAVNQDIKLVNKHVKRNNAQNLLSKPNTEGVQPLILFPEKYQKESVTQNEPRSFDTSMNHYGSQSIKLINPPKKKRQDETIPACSCTRCNIF